MRRLGGLVALLLLVGCPGKTPVTPTSSKAPSSKPTAAPAVASPTPTPALASPSATPPAPTTGPSVAPQPAASLLGIVRVPVYIVSTSGSGIVSNNGAAIVSTSGSGLVSNNGGNVISDQGGSIVSTSGSGYTLAAAPDQLPLVGATAKLYTASGTLLESATTDAKGRYGFKTTPDHNMLVKVELPNGFGTLEAIAPKASKAVDVDLVSSLTTTYIVNQYVDSQAIDKVVTLDKLPADIEADTRAKAAAALTAGPDRLTPDKVVAAVESLRKANPTFDQQMETVKKLLVAAGQSNLGAGRPGTEVALQPVWDLAIAPDGNLLIGDTHRIWELAADGTIDTLVGAGSSYWTSGAPVDGLKGPDAGLFGFRRMAVGPKGDVIMFEPWDDDHGCKLLRLGTDGLMATLISGSSNTNFDAVVDLAFDAAGLPLVLARPNAWLGVVESKDYQPIFTNATKPRFTVGSLTIPTAAGRGLDGKLYAADATGIYRLDPADGSSSQVFGLPAGAQSLLMDHRGNALYQDAAGKLVVHPTSGADVTVLPALPPGAAAAPRAFAWLPDGTAYVAFDVNRVWRVAVGQATVVAGGATAGSGGLASNLAITSVSGVAPLPGGDLVIGNGHQLVRVTPGATASVIAGNPAGGASTGDGGPASAATFVGPRLVRTDSKGTVYVVDNLYDSQPNPAVRRIGADGVIQTVFTPTGVSDLQVADDGTIYWSEYSSGSEVSFYAVRRRKPDGTVDTLKDRLGRPMLAWMPGGELLIWPQAGNEGYAWKDGNLRTLTLAVYDPNKPSSRYSGDQPGSMAVDAKGRIYWADALRTGLYRWDPASDLYEKLPYFKGTGVDDSLDQPSYVVFGSNGDLFIGDVGHKQVKRVAAADL